MKSSQSKFSNDKMNSGTCNSKGSKNTADATEKDMNLSPEEIEEIEIVEEEK